MEPSTTQLVTTALAVLGAVLGTFNAWRNWVQDRVRLEVSVATAENLEGEEMFLVEIVNLSSFPLTITQVGFDRLDPDRHMGVFRPEFVGGEELPVRLASRAAATVFVMRTAFVPEQLLSIRRAYVRTACGKRVVSVGAVFDEERRAAAMQNAPCLSQPGEEAHCSPPADAKE